MSDPTRFDLDDRQRAMLAEMGVRVWWPQRTEDTAIEKTAAEKTAAEVSGHPVTSGANRQATAVSGQMPVAGAPAVSSAQTFPQATQAAQVPLASRPVRPGAPNGASAPSSPTPSSAARTAAASGAKSGTAADARWTPLPAGIADMDWPALQEAVNGCQACALCSARKAPILGSGQALHAKTAAEAGVRWMVVGDSPSQEDDQQGWPYTGPEGQLLDNMLKAVGVRRQTREGVPDVPGDQVKAPASAAQPVAYLTHAVKCRPAGRNPEPAELTTCAAYLSRQVALVQPHVILVMGRFAIQSLLGTTEPMGKLRGRVHDFQGVPVVVTYPPDALLRNAPEKAKAWEDLVLALGIVKPR